MEVSFSHRSRLRALDRTDAHRTSKYRGVTIRRPKKPWQKVRWSTAIAEGDRGLRYLGTYSREVDAATTYDLALIFLGHEPVNFPSSFYLKPASRAAYVGALRALQKLLGGTSKALSNATQSHSQH